MKIRIALLLTWLLLAAATAWAQAPAPSAASVDSREDCIALEGQWKSGGDGWQSACEVPWSRDDCLRLGGAWTQVPKASTGGRCRARVSEWAASQQCMDRGGNWAPQGSGAPQCTFTQTLSRPRARSAADAGKLCTSQAQCSYGCVYRGPEVGRGDPVQGQCRATGRTTGCFSMVENGKSTGRICVQ